MKKSAMWLLKNLRIVNFINKKIKKSEDDDEVVEVLKYEYNNQIFLKTKENILLDITSYDIVGKINKEKVEIW